MEDDEGAGGKRDRDARKSIPDDDLVGTDLTGSGSGTGRKARVREEDDRYIDGYNDRQDAATQQDNGDDGVVHVDSWSTSSGEK